MGRLRSVCDVSFVEGPGGVLCMCGIGFWLSIFFGLFRGMSFGLLALIPMYMYIYFDINGGKGGETGVCWVTLSNIFCCLVFFLSG